VVFEEGFDGLGEAELLHRAELGADDAEDHLPAEAGFYDRGAEAADRGGISEIDVASLFEAAQFELGKVGAGEALGVFGGELLGVLPDRLEQAETSPFGLGKGGDVDVGDVVFLGKAKVFVDVTKDWDGIGHKSWGRKNLE
jgi:hypothetical protein